MDNAAWADNLIGVQPGIRIATPVNLTNTCGGTVVAPAGGTALSLTGGTVPPQVGITPGSCTVSIDVTSTTPGNLINTIPAGGLTGTGGGGAITNTTPASATLRVGVVQPPLIAKLFSPNTIWVGQTSQLTIAINNIDPNSALTGTTLTDTLPAGIVLANPVAATFNGCGATASITGVSGSGSLTLNNATINSGAVCLITVNVTSTVGGTYTNTIPPGAIQTDQSVTNQNPATAPLNVQGVGVSKSFSPPTFEAGSTTTLTITLQNPTGSPLTGVNISDSLPGTVLTVVPGSAATTCGGTASTTIPRTVTLTGGTIPAGSPANPGTCTITVQVTTPPGAASGTFTNTIPAGAMTTNQGITNVLPASAPVTVYATGAGVGAQKNFVPDTIQPGENSRLTITVTAPADSNLTNFSLVDNLPANVTISNSTPASISASCGAAAVLAAVTGGNSISLTNGTILAGTTCQIGVSVTSNVGGVYTNVVNPANVTSAEGQTLPGPITDTLTVQTTSDLEMSKIFTPDTVGPNGISMLTISLTNNNSSPLVNVSLLDNLPGDTTNGVVVAPVPNASTTCGAGVITAVPGTQVISMAGGTIPAQVAGVPGLCTITVNVQGRGAGSGFNVIPTTNVTGTVQGTTTVFNPINDAVAPFTITGLSIGIVKEFNPLTVFGGSASTMSIQLVNPNNADLVGISFTDTMPSGMIVANPVNSSVGTCGGAITATPGNGSFLFSGGSLPPFGDCTLTLGITMTVNGNLTNTIPAGAVTSTNGASNPQPTQASLTNLPGASISKAFSPNPINAGDVSLLTITIQNTGNIPLTGMGLIDTLPGALTAGVVIAGSPAPVNNCGGNLTSVPGTQLLQLTNGSLGASSICTIVIAVTGTTPGSYQNVIPAGNLTTNEGATNNTPAIDTLVINGGAVTASIGDFVWLDADADGIQDAGEVGIGGVTVNLYSSTGTLIGTTTTTAGGFYQFTGLTPGDYFVEFIPPVGFDVSPQDQGGNDAADSDVNPVTGQTIVTTLTAGENDLTWDAGLYQPASLGDTVWNDLDRDGVQDGGAETGIDGVTVNLYRPGYGPDGIPGNGDDNDIVATTTTAGGGQYLFDNLIPGDYFVDFIPPAGFVLSPQDQGGNDATDSDANPVNGQTVVTTLVSGEDDLTWDAGLYQSASLGDFVWLDADADGMQDAGETGIDGVTVNLYSSNGTLIGTTTTSGGGLYLFTDLAPGDYFVEFEPPVGYIVSPQDQGGNDATDSDVNAATGQTIVTNIVAGENDLTWDAGLYQPASLGDFVWNDVDADGVQDAGEAGINGVTVNLYRPGFGPDGIPGNADDNDIVATTTTAGGGLYLFDNLIPGDYFVDFIPPAGFVVSSQDQGGNDAIDSDANPATGQTIVTTLTPGENDLTWDAGLYQPASLGDFVWNDIDADGVQDAGEAGVNGVTVNLYRPGFGPDGIPGNADDNDIVATTTTAGGGLYLFDNLIPGDYFVDFIPPAGFVVSPQDQGGNDATDSDANPATGQTIVTTLTPGENDLTWDAGLYQPASLGDRVWLDADADGVQDAGETGVDGVTVNLYRPGFGPDGIPGNADDNDIVVTTTTAGGGLYLFDNLIPGDYFVDFIPPAGFVLTPQDQGGNDTTDSDANPANGQTIVTTLTPGENDLTWDAGLYQPASLGDFVWNDINANGIQDAGETGIPNVLVELYDSNGVLQATTTTNASGAYLFTDLVPGDYYVRFIPPAGFVVSPQDQGGNDATDSDVNAATGQTIVTTLVPGENDLTWDAGLYQPASLGDIVWNDLNANGIQDGGTETGVDGVIVNLYRPGFGPDGIAGNADDNDIVATTTTAGGGLYLFDNLIPGDYFVDFIPPAGFVLSPQDQGGNDATDSDANPLNGQTVVTTLVPGENDLTWDAGIYQSASLGDFVWFDLDADGVQDAAEVGVDGVTVTLYSSNGTLIGTTTTSGGGLYLFTNLNPGDYFVEFVPPVGYTVSPQDQGGNDATDSDVNAATGRTIVTTIVPGENDLTWDAGLYQPASLGDFVWNDIDADGVQDAGETGVDGVTVNLYSSNGTLIATTTTANGGLYLFDNLVPGDYYVDFIPPAGYAVSPQDQGGNDATDSDANPANGQTIVTTLTAGENDLTWDAGLYQPASLGDFVWNDINANGVQDPGETGIGNVTVELYDSTGALVATTTTNGSGAYLFTGLVPGDYYVRFIAPNGYTISPQDQGGNDATDSDVNAATGQTIVTTLVPGENDLTWDAGMFQPQNSGLTKSIAATNLASTTGTNTAIGEIVTYQLVITVPPGIYTNATLVDTMERGLAFVACDSITAPGLTTDVAGSFTSICANPVPSDAGGGTPADVDRQVTYNFGTLTNAGQTNATITVTYRAIVLDIAPNVTGTALDNSVTWSWTGGSIGPARTTVTVVEPDLVISKTANVNFISNGSEVTFTLTVSHTQASNSDAYDAAVIDVLPTGLSFVPNSLDCTVGAQDPDVSCAFDTATNTLRAEWTVFTRNGGTAQITFRVTGNASLPANGNVTNTANVEWTSMPGNQTTPQSFTPNIFSTERYYDPNDTVNVYNSSSALTLSRLGTGGGGNNNPPSSGGGFLIPLTGFAPNTVTELNSATRPNYGATSVTLEIPSIKVNAPIMGVELKAGNWDVSWLMNQAGWLEGTAYPTWKGNSVLTAHAVNANGKPGLFARLSKVRTGDYIFLYQSGYRYTYQIVSNKFVQPNDINVLKHEEKATITLITCDSYDGKSGTFLRRTVVRAVLIDVSLEK